MKKLHIYVAYVYRILNQFELVDKNNDGFVTLEELNAFSWAVYKEKWATQEELNNQRWVLKNLYPKDILGFDNKFDSEEYVYLQKAQTTTAGSGWTTPSPPTTKQTYLNFKLYSEKPSDFWDPNGDGDTTPEELFRFKMTPEEFKEELSYRFKVK